MEIRVRIDERNIGMYLETRIFIIHSRYIILIIAAAAVIGKLN